MSEQQPKPPQLPERLALFDLDHTLIPFDSGLAWTRFLIARGVLAASAEAVYLAHCHAYVAGTLDIHAMHRSSLQPLVAYPRAEIAAWSAEFQALMAPRLPSAMRALVQQQREAGALCAIVTATQALVAAPFARLFGIDHLVATEAVVSADGRLSAEIDGLPCYREHKVTRVQAWLSREFGATLQSFPQSWFYSDSISDLPLLQAVTHPVAVRPDERLRAHAVAAGWPVMDAGASV